MSVPSVDSHIGPADNELQLVSFSLKVLHKFNDSIQIIGCQDVVPITIIEGEPFTVDTPAPRPMFAVAFWGAALN
ncbi:hypothetical protein FS837_005854, partial [Tulasnella sp. UAMH 9824]